MSGLTRHSIRLRSARRVDALMGRCPRPEKTFGRGLLKVPVAHLGDGEARLPGTLALADRIATTGSGAEELACSRSRFVDCDCAVSTDRRLPQHAAAAPAGPIAGDERLPAGRLNAKSEACQLAVPDDEADGPGEAASTILLVSLATRLCLAIGAFRSSPGHHQKGQLRVSSGNADGTYRASDQAVSANTGNGRKRQEMRAFMPM